MNAPLLAAAIALAVGALVTAIGSVTSLRAVAFRKGTSGAGLRVQAIGLAMGMSSVPILLLGLAIEDQMPWLVPFALLGLVIPAAILIGGRERPRDSQ